MTDEDRCDSFTNSEVAPGLCELCHEPEDQHPADRRDRYAEAIDGTFVYSTDFDAEKAADAAMAVADAEFQAAVARLRRVLDEYDGNPDTHDLIEHIRATLDEEDR